MHNWTARFCAALPASLAPGVDETTHADHRGGRHPHRLLGRVRISSVAAGRIRLDQSRSACRLATFVGLRRSLGQERKRRRRLRPVVSESVPTQRVIRVQRRRLSNAQLRSVAGHDDLRLARGRFVAERTQREILVAHRLWSRRPRGGLYARPHGPLPEREAHLDTDIRDLQHGLDVPDAGRVLRRHRTARLSALGVPAHGRGHELDCPLLHVDADEAVDSRAAETAHAAGSFRCVRQDVCADG